MDPGETIPEAAIREVWEETGVTSDLVEIIGESELWLPYDLPIELVPNIWKGRFRGQEQKWYLMRFLGSDDQVRIDTEQPEFSAWCWQPVEHLVEKIVPFKREVYARVVEEFERYL